MNRQFAYVSYRVALVLFVLGTVVVGCRRQEHLVFGLDDNPVGSVTRTSEVSTGETAPAEDTTGNDLGMRPQSTGKGTVQSAELDFPGLSDDDGRGRERK